MVDTLPIAFEFNFQALPPIFCLPRYPDDYAGQDPDREQNGGRTRNITAQLTIFQARYDRFPYLVQQQPTVKAEQSAHKFGRLILFLAVAQKIPGIRVKKIGSAKAVLIPFHTSRKLIATICNIRNPPP